MQLLSNVADALGQRRLDVHVHVFQRLGPFEASGFDLGADRLESGNDGVALGFGEHAGLGQHLRVGDGGADVVGGETLVETHRRGEALHQRVGRFCEAPGPGLSGRLGVVHVAGVSMLGERVARFSAWSISIMSFELDTILDP